MHLPPRRRLAALVAAALWACGGSTDAGRTTPTSPTTPADNTPATVSISPSAPLSLQSGSTATLTAAVLAKDGRALTTAPVWSSSDAAVASVSDGFVRATRTGAATITATAGTATASVTVTVTPGAAAQLALRVQPAGAVTGAALGTQPVVEIRDAAGNLVAGATASVTASIASGGGTLGGTVSVSAVAGVATFANLAVTGAAGARTLTFAATGLTAATSTAFAITLPAIPILAVDNTAFALSLARGGPSTTATVQITNGGSVAISGLAASVTYEAGQAGGWLATSLSGTTAPASLLLTASSGSLAAGVYRATVQIVAPGATGSPANISVALTIIPGAVASYGTTAEKVRVVDIAGTFAPTITINDSTGRAVTGVTPTFTSRASSVATVAADGRITARSPGDAWIVLTTATSTDSVFVIVPRSATSPILRTSGTTYVARSGDTTFINVIFDPRGTTVGAASLSVGVQTQPSIFARILYGVPTGPPTPVVNNTNGGLFRISFGVAAGTTAPVTVIQLALVGGAVGGTGWLTLLALDVSAPDGTDITSQSTSTRFPFVIR